MNAKGSPVDVISDMVPLGAVVAWPLLEEVALPFLEEVDGSGSVVDVGELKVTTEICY